MTVQLVTLGNCRFEILSEGEIFRGIGAIDIDGTRVRSGRLPLRVYTQTFTGQELSALRLRAVEVGADEVRVRLLAEFSTLPVKLLRDHSFDPIHDLGDWDAPAVAGSGELELVIRLAHDEFNGVAFDGFGYYFDYCSAAIPLFYLLELASWELDGDITGATAISQSSCSAPVATFAEDTAWSTEGVLHFLIEEGNSNPIMTHNLPRWCSHGSFDFQYKGSHTLIGVFERVELIRSVICREAGKAETQTFRQAHFRPDAEATAPRRSACCSTATRRR